MLKSKSSTRHKFAIQKLKDLKGSLFYFYFLKLRISRFLVSKDTAYKLSL